MPLLRGEVRCGGECGLSALSALTWIAMATVLSGPQFPHLSCGRIAWKVELSCQAELMEVFRPAHAFPPSFFLNLSFFWGCQGLADGSGPACAPESLIIISSCAWSPCLGWHRETLVAETARGQQIFENHIGGYANTLQHLAKAILSIP